MRQNIRLTGRLSLAAVLTVAGAIAGTVDAVNKNGMGVAIKGYDVVAYFEQSQPVKGTPQFTQTWNGAVWQFASAEHREKFAAAPEKYAPQFGGYCAYAVSEGHTASIDPEAWKIVDGRLYLNYSKGVQKKWSENQQQRIDQGNRNWPGLHK